MKCYKCGGTGVYDIYNDCPVCDGTGEYDPTDKGFGLPHDWENTVWDTDIYLDDIDKANDIKVPPFTDGQKKVIEATERIANGKLICDIDDDLDEFPKIHAEPQPSKDFLPINCYVCNASGWIAGNSYRHPSKCKRCNGTGEINYKTLTNEDFIRMATTEELAEKLWELYNAGKDDAKTYDTFEYFIDKEDVVEWLKEIHE